MKLEVEVGWEIIACRIWDQRQVRAYEILQ